MKSAESTYYAVANEVERFIREIGQVADDDADFSRQIHLFHSGYLDSHGVMELIVHLEEEFHIELKNDQLSDPAFVNIDGISAIVAAAFRQRVSAGAAFLAEYDTSSKSMRPRAVESKSEVEMVNVGRIPFAEPGAAEVNKLAVRPMQHANGHSARQLGRRTARRS